MVTETTLVNLRPMMYLSSSMSWLSGPALGVRRGACAAVLLDEARLLVVGGNESSSSVGSTEVLDLQDSRRLLFGPGPRLSTQRRECAAISLGDARVLVVGGYDGAHFLSSTEVLDLRTMTFSAGPRLLTRRAAPALALLKSGYVVVVGGKNTYGCLETTEILDTTAVVMSFEHGPRMSMQRSGPAVAPLEGNSLIILGGHDASRTHNTTEVLHVVDPVPRPPTLAVSPGPPLGTPRSYFAGVMLNAGNLHVIGGHDGYNFLDTTDVLNLSSMEFTSGPCMRRRRFMCAAAAITEDRILVLGGTDLNVDHHSTEVLNLPTYSFMPASWMNQL